MRYEKIPRTSSCGGAHRVGAVGCSSEGGSGGTGGTGGTGGIGRHGGSGRADDLCADAGGSGEVTLTEEEITEDTLLDGRLHLHAHAADRRT